MEDKTEFKFYNEDNWADKPIPATLDSEYETKAWGFKKPGEKFAPITIARGKPGDYDVKVDMRYCGICFTDVCVASNQLGGTMYPVVPGHELMGVVEEVGSKVTKVKVGDNVGIGCLCDACMKCNSCKRGDEQYCEVGGWGHIYNSNKIYDTMPGNKDVQTFGGYSGSHCVNEHFIMKVPEGMPMEKAAPILCAGVTMYDPLRHWGATKGNKMCIGIIGIGGLGTMGIKIAKALGHRVVAISTSASKEAMAKEKGADAFVVSTDEASMAKEAKTCDIILNSVSFPHQVQHYMSLLNNSGTIVQIGIFTDEHKLNQAPMIFGRHSVAASLIGGIESTEECLALCAKHNILPDTVTVTANQLD